MGQISRNATTACTSFQFWPESGSAVCSVKEFWLCSCSLICSWWVHDRYSVMICGPSELVSVSHHWAIREMLRIKINMTKYSRKTKYTWPQCLFNWRPTFLKEKVRLNTWPFCHNKLKWSKSPLREMRSPAVLSTANYRVAQLLTKTF